MEKIIEKFNNIWMIAKQDCSLKQKSAVCVSTIDSNGFPQSRFVDLKSVNNNGIIFCTSYDSEKAKNIALDPKVSLTAWWEHVGYQVRVVGVAERITDELADRFWLTRSHEAHVVSTCFRQSELWENTESTADHFINALDAANKSMPRPVNWGGYCIAPRTIEFLKFNNNRVHDREQYTKADSGWSKRRLQP